MYTCSCLGGFENHGCTTNFTSGVRLPQEKGTRLSKETISYQMEAIGRVERCVNSIVEVRKKSVNKIQHQTEVVSGQTTKLITEDL